MLHRPAPAAPSPALRVRGLGRGRAYFFTPGRPVPRAPRPALGGDPVRKAREVVRARRPLVLANPNEEQPNRRTAPRPLRVVVLV